MRQVLSWAPARSPGLRSWAWARLAAFGIPACSSPYTGADAVPGAVVALVRQHHQPGGGQFAHDAPDPGGSQVVHSAGQRPRDPQNVPSGLAMTWTFIPCRRCLPE